MPDRPAKVREQMNVSTNDNVGTSFASSVKDVDADVARTADDELIGDYCDVLLGNCPPEIDVDGVILSPGSSFDYLPLSAQK